MPFQRSTVDLFQGQWVLLVLRVLLMRVRMVMVRGRSQMVTVMLLLLLLSVLRVVLATGTLLLFALYHSSFRRSLFETLL